MRKLISFTFFAILFSTQYAIAQNDIYESGKPEHGIHEKNGAKGKDKKHNGVNPAFCRKAYIGFSTGINNPAGILGFNIDIPVLKNVSISAGAGSSTWGTKIYIDGKYYLKPCHRGWAFGLGVSHSTGWTNFSEDLETIYGKEHVTIDFNPQTNVFVGAYYFWTMGRKYNRFFVEAGYSVPVATYSYTEKIGDPLDNVGEATVKRLSPGGLIIGAGFSFGVH